MSLVMHKHCISSHLQHFFFHKILHHGVPTRNVQQNRENSAGKLILCALTTAHMASSRGQTVTDKAT